MSPTEKFSPYMVSNLIAWYGWQSVEILITRTKHSSYILEDTNLLITEEKDSMQEHRGRAITNEYT